MVVKVPESGSRAFRWIQWSKELPYRIEMQYMNMVWVFERAINKELYDLIKKVVLCYLSQNDDDDYKDCFVSDLEYLLEDYDVNS